MVGMILCGSSRCTSDLDWIVDNGDTDHMTNDSSLFAHSLENTSQTRMVHLPDGNTSPIIRVGDCTLSASLELQRVLLALEFKCNLVSVSKLTCDLGYCVIYFPNLKGIQDLSNGKIKGDWQGV